jgi:hypothetical protein
MASVEPDAFIDNTARPSAGQRRLAEGEAHERRTELVRRIVRVRAVRSRNP